MKILGRRHRYDFDARTQEPCRGREKQRARRDLDDDLRPTNAYEYLREVVGAPRLVKIYEGPYPGPELDPRDWRVYQGEWADVT